MNFGWGSGGLRLTLGAGGAIAAAVIGYMAFVAMQGGESAEPEVAQIAAPQDPAADATQPETDTVTTEAGDASDTGDTGDAGDAPAGTDVETGVTADEPAPDAAPEGDAVPVLAPTFDTVRIEADGAALVAGRATPGALVAIFLGADRIADVTVDGSGAFVAFVDIPPSEEARVLSLVEDPDGAAVVSDQTVIVAPIAAPVIASAEIETVAPASEPEPETATQTTEAAAEPASAADPAPEPEPEPQAEPEPTAPPLLLSDAEGVRVLQPAGTDQAPDVMSSVALDAITYDPAGEVTLSGRGSSEGFVQIYLDNTPISASRIAPDGNWRSALPSIDTGVYTLRVDEMDAEGAVVSRIETPFKREEPEAVAAAMADEVEQDGFQAAVKVVQPGNTLWAIATERYGSGVMYVQVFEANKDRIRNPDLIYPGQVFVLPAADQ